MNAGVLEQKTYNHMCLLTMAKCMSCESVPFPSAIPYNDTRMTSKDNITAAIMPFLKQAIRNYGQMYYLSISRLTLQSPEQDPMASRSMFPRTGASL